MHGRRKTLLHSTNKCNCLQLKPFANNRTLTECICNRRSADDMKWMFPCCTALLLLLPLLHPIYSTIGAFTKQQESVHYHFKCHHFGVISDCALLSWRLIGRFIVFRIFQQWSEEEMEFFLPFIRWDLNRRFFKINLVKWLKGFNIWL